MTTSVTMIQPTIYGRSEHSKEHIQTILGNIGSFDFDF